MATLQDLQRGQKLTLEQIRQRAGFMPQQSQPQGILGKANQLSQQFNRGVEQFGIGVAKGLGSTAFGIGKLGEKIVNPAERTLGLKETKLGEKPKFLEPQGTAQKVGFGAEQVGEFFAPSGLAAKGVKVAEAGIKASKLGKFAQGAAKLGARSAIGAAEVGSVSAAQQGQLNEEVKKNMIIGGAIPLAGFVMKGVAKAGIPLGKKIEQTIIRPTSADLKDGFKVDNVFKYDLGGGLARTEQKTHALITHLANQLDKNASAIKIKVDVSKILNDTAREMSRNKPEFFGANTKIANAFKFLKQELQAISPRGVTSFPDAQKIKRGTGKLGAWQYGSRDPDANALEKVANAFYTKLKLELERISPKEFGEINKKLTELIPIENALIRRIPVAARNNVLSLSDAVTAIPGLLNSSNWWLFALNRVLKSGNVANALVKLGTEPPSRGTLGTAILGAGRKATLSPTEQTLSRGITGYLNEPKIGLGIQAVKGSENLTTKFLQYVEQKLAKDPKALLSKQEIMDFARRPKSEKQSIQPRPRK